MGPLGFVVTSVLITIAGAGGALWTVLRLPTNYLVCDAPWPAWTTLGPLSRALARIGKNALGFGLILAGVVLAIPGVPGPGLLIAGIGFLLLDVPGKRRIERAVFGHRSVLAAANRVRSRFGTPALEAPK